MHSTAVELRAVLPGRSGTAVTGESSERGHWRIHGQHHLLHGWQGVPLDNCQTSELPQTPTSGDGREGE